MILYEGHKCARWFQDGLENWLRKNKVKLRLYAYYEETRNRHHQRHNIGQKGTKLINRFGSSHGKMFIRRTGEKGMSRENVIWRNPITKEQSILCGRRVILLLLKRKKYIKN
jgi:hypothetical protein